MEENRGKNVKCTYLNRLVPACRVDNGVLGWGTFNGGNPVLVGLQGLDTVTKSVPDLDGLVSGSRQQEVWVCWTGGKGGDPTVVAL